MKTRILTPNKRLGYHVSPEQTLFQTLLKYPMLFTLQMYLGSPHSWSHRKLIPEDISQTRDYCLTYDKNFYVHASCIVHLGKAKNDQAVTIAYLNGHLKQLADLPGSLIVHIGKGQQSTIALINDLLSQVLIPEATGRAKHKLVLENAAGQGYEKGRNWQELYDIFQHADLRIGLCIDTQHSFGAGMVDFRSVDEVKKFFQICDTYFPGRLQCIHLNDSAVAFGSCVDRHGDTLLGEGYIWKTDKTSLIYLLQEGHRRELDFILETGGGQRDLDLIHDLSYDGI